jgi:hypothetical protein
MSTTSTPGKLRGLTAAFLVVLSIGLVCAMGGIAYLALKGSDQSAANFDELKQIEAVSKRLIDCTEPGGKCFEEGQKRTAEAVVGINEGTLRVIVAALSCQDDGVTGQKALSRCTIERAKADPQP